MQFNRRNSHFMKMSSSLKFWPLEKILCQISLCFFIQQLIPTKRILTMKAAGDMSFDLCSFDPKVNNLEEFFKMYVGDIAISLRTSAEFLHFFICDL